MWRSFFFAVGAMLIILGLECLVADRFEISNRTRIPKLVAQMFEEGKTQEGIGSRLGSTGDSRYGKSLFQSPFSNNQSLTSQDYYGGVSSSNLRQPANRPFSLAGFGGKGSENSSNLRLNPGKPTRVIYTKDWMPWSLLAAGTLVVLYTKSTTKGGFSSD